MYRLTDEQIDFILDDISARGVKLVSLQQDLLDHICCMVEQDLDPDGDFEGFYRSRIVTFYKSDLAEIEVETITLLTLKNYYVMKKIMLLSGGASAAAMTVGLFLKFMHMAGASVLIFLGVILLSLVFLPLLFTLKIREKQNARDKAIIGIGTLAAILISFGVLFKVMHWPGANVMAVLALAIMLVVFLPVYFFTGIRNPETKVNTIVSSVFILYGCAMVLMLVRSPAGSQKIYAANAASVFQSEKILGEQQKQTALLLSRMPAGSIAKTGREIMGLCENLKSFLLESETGSPRIDANGMISDADARDYLKRSPQALRHLSEANQKIAAYNASLLEGQQKLAPLDISGRKMSQALTCLIQAQMTVLQNETAVALLK